MSRNLILTGGPYHPFADSAAALAALLEDVDIDSEITTDIHGGLASLSRGNFDLLTVFALRWPMTGEKYDAHRATWGFELPVADRQHISNHVAAGRSILALHTASICFGDWPEWRTLIGAGWNSGTSFHPPFGPVDVEISADDHPITTGLPGFRLNDEAYTHLDMVEGIEPLAAVRAQGQTEFSPCLWAREIGSARVVYDALGHDRGSLEHPVHRSIVTRSAMWALHRPHDQIQEARC